MVPVVEENLGKLKVPDGRVLVTGAGGFIGSTLCRALLDHGCRDLAGLDLGPAPGDLAGMLEWYRGDITDPESCRSAFTGVSCIFHLAALATDWAPRRVFGRINHQGTANVIELCRRAGVRRLVHMSTLAVHPFRGYRDADESAPVGNRINGYCESKAAAERLVNQIHGGDGLETTIVRPGAIIHGPGDTTAFVHLAPVLMKGSMPLVAGGRVLACYSDARNLVRGLVLAAGPAGAGETFVITDDVRITLREYLEQVAAELGTEVRFYSVPRAVAQAGGVVLELLWKLAGSRRPPPVHRYRVGLVSRDFHFGCEKAKRLLGYRPVIDFARSIRDTARWYLALNT
ncbi:MAG: hypothetical protein DRI34_06310 [Deltaproteobacteria bacterium]|nr:MAG: hypothetical protein DRI34_06310 [Deltaproteobacteria bacterium]